MKKITKKILTVATTLSLALSAFPAIGFAENEVVTQTIAVGDNSVTHNSTEIYFGKSLPSVLSNSAILYFDLNDISQIQKLDLTLGFSSIPGNSRPHNINAYAIADKLPAIGDIASYAAETPEHIAWTNFINNSMTQLAKEDRIIFPSGALTNTQDITKVLNSCEKENGYLIIKVNNGNNIAIDTSKSALCVTYKDGYTAPDYLDDVNASMSAADMKAAMTNAAADYFGVDNDALYDMSGVYESLVAMLEEDDFTKESFKEAFDAEVEKYIETKEIIINNVAYFNIDSNTTGLTNLNFALKSSEGNLLTALNRNVPFIGAKIDNAAAVKEIELYTYASSDNTTRQFTVRGAYILDEFKTGNESVYQVPAEGEINEVYTFWKDLGDDFINSSNKYNTGSFNIGRDGNKVMTACSNDSIKNIKTVDLTDYVTDRLNKYGEDKYLTLHINAGDNMNLKIVASDDGNKMPKFIVKYDKTVKSSAKALAWEALEEAMSADDIKAIVENYGTALGIDKITKIKDNAGIYAELLSNIDDYDNIEDFISKVDEIYNKYTVVKNVMPSEGIMYNANGEYIAKMDDTFTTGKRYITQYSREALGDGKNILEADYRISTSESNEFAGNTFVRTIPAIEFEGFDQTKYYYLNPTNEKYNAAAAAAVSNDVQGTQWLYIANSKLVSRIKFIQGANEFTTDVTDSLKEKLNMNLNKVAYVIGVEQQDGKVSIDNSTSSAAVLSVTYDRTYNASAAMAAYNAAKTVEDYKKALTDYAVEFNVTSEQLPAFDDYSDDAIVEGFAALKENCETIFDIEEALKTVNFKTSMTKFEIQSFTDDDGDLKANVKKLSAYNGDAKALFVSYKTGQMIEVVEAENVEKLITAEKGNITELVANGSLGEYDTVKVIIINSYAQLTPLAVVYSPVE